MHGTDSKKGRTNGRPWCDVLESLRLAVKVHGFLQERVVCLDGAGDPGDVEAFGSPPLDVSRIMPAFAGSLTASRRTSDRAAPEPFCVRVVNVPAACREPYFSDWVISPMGVDNQ